MGKFSPLPSCGDPQACETSRLPHLPDNPLTDGGVSGMLSVRVWAALLQRNAGPSEAVKWATSGSQSASRRNFVLVLNDT
jgi:hypothetical protein